MPAQSPTRCLLFRHHRQHHCGTKIRRTSTNDGIAEETKTGRDLLSGGRQSPVNSTHQFCARNHRIGVAEAGEGDTGVAVRGNGGSHQHTILKPPLSHNSVQQLVASSNWAIETGRQPMDAALFSTARTVADGRSGERCTIQATTACAHDPPRTKYYRRPRGDS